MQQTDYKVFTTDIRVTAVTATLKVYSEATNDLRWKRQTGQGYYVPRPNTLCHAKNVYYGGSGCWQGHGRNGKDLSGSVDCHIADEVG